MIETALTTIASVVTTMIIPKAIEAIGEKVGETAFDQSGKIIQAIRPVVEEKLVSAGTGKLLTRAEEKPSEGNRQVLQAELVSQMEEDQAFADKLQKLLTEMKSDNPELQNILDNAIIKGELEIDGVEIKNQGKPYGSQVIGRNLKVGKNAKFGKISIENKSE